MVHRLIGLISVALLAPALYWTLRLEYADWLFVKGNVASIRQAVRLAPGTAEYYSALAEAEPERAVTILRQAVELNPRDASLRLQLGEAEDQHGDAAAQADLLEAARLDTGFGPRWALSDFYFHRHDTEKFWPVTKAALAVSYGDVSGLFRNCWALNAGAPTILDRAIPSRPAVLRQYLDFLVSEGRLDAAVPVAGRVLAAADRQSVPALLKYCDSMLAKWRGEEALVVWQGLGARELIGDETGRGFDWQVSTPEGIDVERSAGVAVLNFSGRQAENIELISQYVALQPHHRYTLGIRYRAGEIATGWGIECALFLKDGRDLLKGRGALREEFSFETPADATLGRIVLGYHRVPGTTRIEGSLTVGRFELAQGDRP